jgi:hypothetical protein
MDVESSEPRHQPAFRDVSTPAAGRRTVETREPREPERFRPALREQPSGAGAGPAATRAPEHVAGAAAESMSGSALARPTKEEAAPTAERGQDAALAHEPAVVEVHIGRIDVVASPAGPPPSRGGARPLPTLAEYLARPGRRR